MWQICNFGSKSLSELLRAVTPHAGELFVPLTGLADPSQWFARNPEAKSGEIYSQSVKGFEQCWRNRGFDAQPFHVLDAFVEA